MAEGHLELELDQVPANGLTGCLLHGFGAGPRDLVPLVPLIGGARRWFAMQAPVPIEVGGTQFGRAWFPGSPEQLQEVLYGTYLQDLPRQEPAELREAAALVRGFLETRGVPLESTVIVGFSQGAMVTAELLRQGLVGDSSFPAAAILLSGGLVADRWWRELRTGGEAATERGVERVTEGAAARDVIRGIGNVAKGASERAGGLPPVFQSHGRQDRILAYSDGEALRNALTGVGFDVWWHPFEGDHTVPESVATAARDFLSIKLGNISPDPC